jgi:hypothetical protein
MLSKKNMDLCKLHTKNVKVLLDTLILKNVKEATVIKQLLEDITSLKSSQRVIWSAIYKQTKK